MVCLDTPTSRATSSTARPASTCFKALIISASLCLPLDMVLPLSFDEIIFNFVRNQGSRSRAIIIRFKMTGRDPHTSTPEYRLVYYQISHAVQYEGVLEGRVKFAFGNWD